MTGILLWCLVGSAIFYTGRCVSSKMDFGNDDATIVIANSTRVGDEDVEVKHTIVVSTKLKNNNRRGLHARGEGEDGVLTYNIGDVNKPYKEDSGEVPIIKGYNAVETTAIHTPDTRFKSQVYPDSVFVNRNIRDDPDSFPNVALTPSQWKPSTFYNNINWLYQDGRPNVERRSFRPNTKLNRKITDDAMRDFYCKKCREYSGGHNVKGCIQQRSPWVYESTTPKIKLDGKLAKLN